MNNFDAIKQMNEEELAFFLAAAAVCDPNDILCITRENTSYYMEYLNKEDGEGLLEATRQLMKGVK